MVLRRIPINPSYYGEGEGGWVFKVVSGAIAGTFYSLKRLLARVARVLCPASSRSGSDVSDIKSASVSKV